MRMKTSKTTGSSPMAMMNGSSAEAAAHEWELRPGGMLVQKRNPDSDRTSAPPPTIRVRVKYGSVYHEIHISSQATFGKLRIILVLTFVVACNWEVKSGVDKFFFRSFEFLMIAGELKKLLTGPTGLHHEDQKLIYKDKERDSKAFLDVVGVKDKSKLVLVEDPISQEKRLLEMRKNAKMEKASKSISEISLEVDRLAGQVTSFFPTF